MTLPSSVSRHDVVRRGQWLTWATIGYNALEGVLSIGAGLLAGSVALVGFGFDSVLELTSSVAALWRLGNDRHAVRRARTERQSLRVIGACFLLLAVYVAAEASRSLLAGEAPAESPLGIAIAASSLVVMPLLARAKRRVAEQLSSRALNAEARQTEVCMILSAILLGGLALNTLLGWWWADSLAALAMAPLIALEGVRALRGQAPCGDGCGGSSHAEG
ncbi:MAG TPA: cation transporter [Gemmatimonadaceae bacterium]|nr:cation transporter [Gemmatimonadaceae bacterium]